MIQTMNRLLTIAAMLVLVTSAVGQVSPEEHASHHPEEQTTEDGAPEQSGDGESSGGMGDAMGAMMAQASDAKAKEIYPTLMNLPDLSPEDLEEIQQRATERIQSGIGLMTEALEQLIQASSGDDFEGMSESAVTFREGFARVESGLATRQALSENRPAREIALDWFRREMNLQPLDPGEARGPFGLSWFHFLSMVILSLFAIAMLRLYALKMRRVSMLIDRLAAEGTEK